MEYIEICSRCDAGIKEAKDVCYEFGNPVCEDCKDYYKTLRSLGLEGKGLYNMFYEVNPFLYY